MATELVIMNDASNTAIQLEFPGDIEYASRPSANSSFVQGPTTGTRRPRRGRSDSNALLSHEDTREPTQEDDDFQI